MELEEVPQHEMAILLGAGRVKAQVQKLGLKGNSVEKLESIIEFPTMCKSVLKKKPVVMHRVS